MLKIGGGEMGVSGCRLQVGVFISWGLQVGGCKLGVAGRRLEVVSWRLGVTGGRLQVVTSCCRQFIGYLSISVIGCRDQDSIGHWLR